MSHAWLHDCSDCLMWCRVIFCRDTCSPGFTCLTHCHGGDISHHGMILVTLVISRPQGLYVLSLKAAAGAVQWQQQCGRGSGAKILVWSQNGTHRNMMDELKLAHFERTALRTGRTLTHRPAAPNARHAVQHKGAASISHLYHARNCYDHIDASQHQAPCRMSA